jgi:hypothetical protein
MFDPSTTDREKKNLPQIYLFIHFYLAAAADLIKDNTEVNIEF